MLGRAQRTRAFVLAAIVAAVVALAAPALAAADWGAIAVSPRTGKVGVSYDYSTARHAKRRALHECHQRGCRIAVWVFDGYAALVQKRNGVFVAGYGRTHHKAVAKARRRAHERAPVVASVYSG